MGGNSRFSVAIASALAFQSMMTSARAVEASAESNTRAKSLREHLRSYH